MRSLKRDSDEECEMDDDHAAFDEESETKRLSAEFEQDNSRSIEARGTTYVILACIRNYTLLLFNKLTAKNVISAVLSLFLVLIVWDAFIRSPEDRWLQPDFKDKFLLWVQEHPLSGIFACLFVIASSLVFLVPIGTPLTVGCGLIYKSAYGWQIGLPLATAVAMAGSSLGSITCFLLGRYFMQEQVRKWIRIYPRFEAIDAGAAEHGLRIMAMLYLTPILPLGPVSYMCGTTSMALSSFVLARIAALPLTVVYVFIGASTGVLVGQANSQEFDMIETNQTHILSGIGLSFNETHP